MKCDNCGSPMFQEKQEWICSNLCQEIECPHSDGDPCSVCRRLGEMEKLIWPKIGPRQRRGRKIPRALEVPL